MKISLESRTCFKATLAAWGFLALFALFYIAPDIDDGYYMIPSIAVMHDFVPEFAVGLQTKPLFFLMPTFSVFNGFSYKIMTSVGIPLTGVTYRFFHFLCLALAIYLGLLFIKRAKRPGNSQHFLGESSFLLFLAITPFIMNCWIVRPEPLGIACLMGAVLCMPIHHPRGYKSAGLAGFLLGISAILNPIFVFLGIPFALYWLFKLLKERSVGSALALVAAGLVPVAAFLCWFFAYQDEAVTQLFARAREIKPKNFSDYFVSFYSILTNVAFWSTRRGMYNVMNGIYRAWFYLPLLILMILAAYLVLKKFQRSREMPNPTKTYWLLFLAGCFLALIAMAPFPGYFAVVVYFFALIVASFLAAEPERLSWMKNKAWVRVLALIFFVGGMSQFFVFHTAKHFIGGDKYYLPTTFAAEVGPQVRDGDIVITNTGFLVPPLASFLKGRGALRQQLYFTFLIAGEIPENWNQDVDRFLYEFLPQQEPRSIIWAVMKDVIDVDRSKPCFVLKGVPINVLLEGYQVIYEDNKNLVYRADRIIVGQRNESCAVLREKVAN